MNAENHGGYDVIRNFLKNFMAGRYGPDHLNLAIIGAAFLLYILQRLTHFAPLLLVSYLLLFIAVFRLLSRDLTRRRAENDKFIRYWWPVRTKLLGLPKAVKARRDYRFFKCPGCKNKLRVPKRKGKLQVTCPKCGERFIKKT